MNEKSAGGRPTQNSSGGTGEPKAIDPANTGANTGAGAGADHSTNTGTGAGAGAGTNSDDTANTANTGEKTETAGAVVEEPLQIEYVVPEPKKRGRRPGSTVEKTESATAEISIAPKEIANLLAGGFFLYSQSKPEPLRPAWDWAPTELMPIANPLAKMIADMPEKYIKTAGRLANPLALLMGAYAIISASQQKEKEIIAHLKQVHNRANEQPAGNTADGSAFDAPPTGDNGHSAKNGSGSHATGARIYSTPTP